MDNWLLVAMALAFLAGAGMVTIFRGAANNRRGAGA